MTPTPSPFHYVIIRKELTGGAALAQVGHAAGESAALHVLSKVKVAGEPLSFGNKVVRVMPDDFDPLVHQLPDDTRLAVLGATKEQLGQVMDALLRENVPHKAITETDGPLAGMVTSIGLVTDDKASLAPLLGPQGLDLKPFSLK